MSSLEELRVQESQLKNKLEQTKNIDERRKVRADLRAVRTKSEKLSIRNSNEPPNNTVSTSRVVLSMNKRSDDFENKSKQIEIKLPCNEQTVPEVIYTTSTYKFDMSNKSDSGPNRRHQIGYNGSDIEEKRPRKYQEVNNNQVEMAGRAGKENISSCGPPKRMSRRASLAELFKIEEGANKPHSKAKPHVAQPQTLEPPRLGVSAPPSSRRDVVQDDKTKQDLIQNLSRLRSRRRSIREIQNRDELEGLMYVKQGGTVKLLSTTEDENTLKEQRRVRRSSRKEERGKMMFDGHLLKHAEDSDALLSPVKEESPSPSSTSQFRYGTAPMAKTYGAPKPEQPKGTGTPYGRGRFGGGESPAPHPAPQTQYGRQNTPSQPQPRSFLPDKKEAEPMAPQKFGSVADRMAYFRQAAEKEKKAAATSAPKKVPAPSPKTPTGASGAPEQKEKVSLKKAADPNKAPRELKKKPVLKRQMSVSSLILTWCKDVTEGYKGVNITNFSGSFANGLAFCALIHKFNPDKFDFDSLESENRRYNFQLAFDTATSAGVPALLDVDDMFRLKKPEPRSVQCYVQMIFSKYRPKDLDTSNLIIA